jgi:hypothetical protein
MFYKSVINLNHSMVIRHVIDTVFSSVESIELTEVKLYTGHNKLVCLPPSDTTTLAFRHCGDCIIMFCQIYQHYNKS